MENVVNLGAHGDPLAKAIHADIAEMEKAAAAFTRAEGLAAQAQMDWARHALDLCVHIAEKRAQIKSDPLFGRWWKEQNFTLGKNDRAQAIRMAANIDAARRCFAATKRRSIEHIGRSEFDKFLPSAGAESRKSQEPNATPVQESAAPAPEAAAPEPTSPPPAPEPAPTPDLATFKHREHEDALAMLLESERYGLALPTTDTEIMERCGVSKWVAAETYAALKVELRWRKRAEEESLAHAIDPATLPKKHQEQLAILERRLRAQIEAVVEARVNKRFRETLEETVLPSWKKKIEFAENFDQPWRRRSYPLTKAEFNKIRAVCHSDWVKDGYQEKATEAFVILNQKKDLLVMPEAPKDEERGAPPLPKTAADWAALREKVRAENAAKARKAAETKKQKKDASA